MEVEVEVNVFSLPPELHTLILGYLEPPDILSYSRCCKRFRGNAECGKLWRSVWARLSRKTPFTFPATAALAVAGVNFKDCCKRLWRILVVGSEAGLVPSKCGECRRYTCECRLKAKKRVAVDIGGKISWIITANLELNRHLTMIALPKVLKCYDCDATPSGPEVNSHTALHYCSQRLNERPVTAVNRPFCLFCDEQRVNHLLRERKSVMEAQQNRMSDDVLPSYSGMYGHNNNR